MRVRSIIFFLIIIGLIGGGGYFLWNNWDKVRGVFLTASGYTPAEKPEDAMDQFAKAIKNREYDAAARYVTEDYANFLKNGKTAADALANHVDSLARLSADRSMHTDGSRFVLRCLDPFPGDFRRRSSEKLVKRKDGSYEGRFVSDYTLPNVNIEDYREFDPKMFRNTLMPVIPGNVPAFNFLVRIVPEKEGDSTVYKLEIPVNDVMKKELESLNSNYKKYNNAITHLCDSVRVNGSYDSPKAFERDVVTTMLKQN